MSARAEDLAQQFEAANDAVISAIEGLSDEQWTRHCASEHCTVAALAYHVGGAHPFLMNWVQSVADGADAPPPAAERINQANANNAVKHAHSPKGPALERLRENGAAVAARVRALSDEQLDRTQPVPRMGGAVSAQRLIEAVLIGHPRQHLEGIRAATT